MKYDSEDSRSEDSNSSKRKTTKRSLDSTNQRTTPNDESQRHSPSSMTSSEMHSPIDSSCSSRPNHVETLRYIFPFYSRGTLKTTLDECNDNILQAVLRISRDLFAFRLPFIDSDQLGRIRNHAMTYSCNNNYGSLEGQPDCCQSPYCPKQMAFQWERQRAVPAVAQMIPEVAQMIPEQHPREFIDPRAMDVGYYSAGHESRFSPEKRSRFEFDNVAGHPPSVAYHINVENKWPGHEFHSSKWYNELWNLLQCQKSANEILTLKLWTVFFNLNFFPGDLTKTPAPAL